MTSLTPIRTEQPSVAGRSVRDIVETSPEQVNEVWCRKIFRQILQSLELQYAMHMPHRAITPDTIVFHENGEPLLVPALVGEADRTEADDLQALAAIVHYGITRDPVPAGPLRGRALEGYSESLMAAVDRCLSPDPAQRPQSIDELRNILGIVSLGPPVGSQLAPARMGAPAPGMLDKASATVGGADAGLPPMQGAAQDGRSTGLGRWQRWAIAVGGGAVLAALALTMFAELRDSGSYDHIVLTLPQTGEHGHAQDQAASIGASDGGATASSAQAGLPGAMPTQAGAADGPQAAATGTAALPTDETGAPRRVHEHHGLAARAGAIPEPAGDTNYRLRIQPWGVVYVDGVDRGVSPPVKRLTLAPGKHTLRVTNPAFQDRVLEVDTGSGGGVLAVDFNDDTK